MCILAIAGRTVHFRSLIAFLLPFFFEVVTRALKFICNGALLG